MAIQTGLIIAAIIVITAGVAYFAAFYLLRWRYEHRFREWQQAAQVLWQKDLEKAQQRAISQSRAVLGGKFTEQMTPFLPEFKYDPTEARFIGSPIDLIVFPGLASGEPREIVIVEIKTGRNCQLTPPERKIQKLVEEGMVRWELLQPFGRVYMKNDNSSSTTEVKSPEEPPCEPPPADPAE